jgi:hypothetical protein
LNDIIKNYKTLTKGSRKKIRNQKKDQIGIIIIIIEKKFINLIWRIKLKAIKTDKMAKEKNKKLKVKEPNKKNIICIQIKN